ncbi:MAG: CAP domain-containing protein [Planctomycetota bacterium]
MRKNLVGRYVQHVGWCLLAVALTTSCNISVPGSGTNGGGSGIASIAASLLEQLSLERINRARLKPTAEAAAAGIALNEGVPAGSEMTADPKQPLALNASLNLAAQEHSQDMLTRDYFEHNSLEGTTPFQRITNAGYAYTSAGENLAWRGSTGVLDEVQTVEEEHTDLFVDAGVSDRGHRTTMLNEAFREVGISAMVGSYTDAGTTYNAVMQTQDYGTPPSGSTFVLGVVYTDANANGQYDYGEGSAGADVTLAGVTKNTNVAGGFSFEVSQAGTYTLRFATGHTQTLTIQTGDRNVKVDLVDGLNVVVNLGVGVLN